MDQNQERRRGNFHRGRRSPDRRGMERRTPPQSQEHAGRDHVDVEQIMRDVRARIAQRSGIELSSQQIQELAARRLESILDPRTMKPGLLDEMRKAASMPAAGQGVQDPPVEPAYTFEEATLYESHRGLMRFFRRLFNPLLKLLFNPTPIARALNTQSRLNVEAARREAEREGRQTEWNALQYQIVQRLVTEVSRVSIEAQAMSTRIESLSAKVDFNERRVRGIEGTVHQARPAGRPAEIQVAASVPTAEAATAQQSAPAVVDVGQQSGEGARRRRRRRRGRRGGGMPGDALTVTPGGQQTGQAQEARSSPPDAEPDSEPDAESYVESDFPPVTTEGEVLVQPEPRQEATTSESASAPPPPTWEPPPTLTEE